MPRGPNCVVFARPAHERQVSSECLATGHALIEYSRRRHTVYELQHADYGPDMDRFAPATHPIWVLSAEGSMDV